MILPTHLNNMPLISLEEVELSAQALLNIQQHVWSYHTRTLTAGTKDAEIDAIKERTDNLPDEPASYDDVVALTQ